MPLAKSIQTKEVQEQKLQQPLNLMNPMILMNLINLMNLVSQNRRENGGSTRPPNCAKIHSKCGSMRRMLIRSLTAPLWIFTVPFEWTSVIL